MRGTEAGQALLSRTFRQHFQSLATGSGTSGELEHFLSRPRDAPAATSSREGRLGLGPGLQPCWVPLDSPQPAPTELSSPTVGFTSLRSQGHSGLTGLLLTYLSLRWMGERRGYPTNPPRYSPPCAHRSGRTVLSQPRVQDARMERGSPQCLNLI